MVAAKAVGLDEYTRQQFRNEETIMLPNTGEGRSMNQRSFRCLAWTVLMGMTVMAVGCSQQQGASFEARLLMKNASGELEEAATSSHSHFAVNGKGDFGINGKKMAWEVMAMDSDKVTVSVSFAGSKSQEFQISAGENKEVLFDDGNIGVRIYIHGIKYK